MRLANLHFRTVGLAFLALGVGACQSAHKPAAVVPPAQTPALKAAQTPASNPVPAQATATKTPEAVPVEETPLERPTPAAATAPAPPTEPDGVAALIARAEKEYQAGLANQ